MKRRLMIARSTHPRTRNSSFSMSLPRGSILKCGAAMYEFLQEINAAGTTIILTTHYLEDAEASVPKYGHYQPRRRSSLNRSIQRAACEISTKKSFCTRLREFPCQPYHCGEWLSRRESVLTSTPLEVLIEQGPGPRSRPSAPSAIKAAGYSSAQHAQSGQSAGANVCQLAGAIRMTAVRAIYRLYSPLVTQGDPPLPANLVTNPAA